MDYGKQLLIVCPLLFLAGFVDSIAGGGGLISLPAYYAAGLPPTMAGGTNKFSSSCGTVISTARFVKNKCYHQSVVFSIAGALMGGVLGSTLATLVGDVVLRYVMLIVTPMVAIFVLQKREFREEANLRHESLRVISGLCFAIGLIIGFYDGFFGPGTGTFLIIAFTSIIGFDLRTSMGNTKIVNLSSNLASMFVYLANGSVLFKLAIPAAMFCIAGNFIGSGLALRRGAKIVKPMLVLVLGLLLLKIANDLFLLSR